MVKEQQTYDTSTSLSLSLKDGRRTGTPRLYRAFISTSIRPSRDAMPGVASMVAINAFLQLLQGLVTGASNGLVCLHVSPS